MSNGMMGDALRTAIKKRAVRAVLLKDDGAFDAFYKELQAALTKVYDQAMKEAIIDGLERLKDLGGAGSFGLNDKEMILGLIESKIGAEALTALTRKPVIDLTDGLYRLGFQEVKTGTGLDIAFMRPDLDALDILKSGNLYRVGNSWNIYTQERIEAALTDYFNQGMTREGLMERYAFDLATIADKSRPYWAIMADHTATKTREMGRVAGYDRAGIAYVQVRAQLDDRTTPICRAMHGRVIPVSQLKNQRDKYLKATKTRNMDAAKRAWTMHSANGADQIAGLSTANLPANTANPPYHFRCRTITVAYFIDDEGEIGAWKRKTYDRVPLAKKDIAQIIDRAKSARWPHAATRKWHFNKHKDEFGLTSQTDYSQSATDLIRSGKRDVYLAIRKGKLDAVFSRAGKNKNTGENGHFLTVVDVEENKIKSHYHRSGKTHRSKRDDVQNVKQPGRGIAKWLIN